MLENEKPQEECGVFGIWSREPLEAADWIYYGLMALQHRGQESAGMAVCSTLGPVGNMNSHKGMGLVSEVFRKEDLLRLHGNSGIGHVRYSTTGGSVAENAQPFTLGFSGGSLALAHNGNITNAGELRAELEARGEVFAGTTDSEVAAFLVAEERMRCGTIEEAAGRVVPRLKGGYALLILSCKKLVGIRDPYGIKPLCLGKAGEVYILASESTALKAVGAELIRDIRPGEMISVSEEGIRSVQLINSEKRAHCIFEYIYFAKLDSKLDGISVYDARTKGGRALARRYPAEADVVTGVPDSGLAAAVGYADESGIPFRLAFAKNNYVGRTFIKPEQSERSSAVHLKLRVLEEVVRDRRVVLIDDSIVRGTTIRNLISEMRTAGAREVHVRISSPPFLHPCFYGTDIPDISGLIASEYSAAEICRRIGADSLEYMCLEDLPQMTGELPLCRACFDAQYPV